MKEPFLMNKKTHKIICFILIQAFLLINCSFLGNISTGNIFLQPAKSALSPAININALSFQNTYRNSIAGNFQDTTHVPQDAEGVLDGITILRFSHAYTGTGGMQQHLRGLNKALLERSRMTIIQAYLTDDENDTAQRTQTIGKGTLITVPILAKVTKNSILRKDVSSDSFSFWFNLAKKVSNAVGMKNILKNWLLKSSYGEFLCKLPLIKTWHANIARYSNPDLTAEKIKEILDKYKIDLISLHPIGLTDEEIALELVSGEKGIPIIVQNHNSNSLFNDIIVKRMVSKATAVAGINEQDIPKYLQGKLANLSNGIDTEFFKPDAVSVETASAGKPLILLPARVVPGKGHRDLILTAGLLKKQGINAQIVFAGLDDDYPALKNELCKLAVKSGLSGDVIFTGALSQKELRVLYAQSDIVVLPSDNEGLGRVLLEAQAMEKPVVAYNTGGIPEALIDGETGYLVGKGDIKQFARRIEELLSDEGKRIRVGRKGREFVQDNFSLTALVERHELFYLDVLRRSSFAQEEPNILVDKTDLVTKKTLYSDVNAFRTMLIDRPPTAAFIKELLESTSVDTLPLPWTRDEIRSFSLYLPSVVHKLEENIGKERLFELTGVDGISDEDRIIRSIFQLQTELSQRIATMDSYIVENRGTYKTFLNKVYVYNRITAMFVALGLLTREEAKSRFKSYKIPAGREIDTLIEIKKGLIHYLNILPIACVEPEKVTYRESLNAEEKERYGYVDWLKETLGDNLKAVILYGSAAREATNFNDFDNWIVVKDLDKAYQVVGGIAPTFKDGRVIIRGKEGKEITLNLIPESIFAKIFHFNAVCDRNIDHCKVLYGSVDVYKISESEIIERSISSVYLRLKTLRAAALWIARAPEEVMGKPALFKYFVKNTQFVMNVCLNYLEGLRVISKSEIKARLRKIGMTLFDYQDSPEYIAEAMIQTAVDSSLLYVKYLKDRQPDFSFLNFYAIKPQVREAMLAALKRNREMPRRQEEMEVKPAFPIEDAAEVFRPGVKVFDFGSGAVPLWAMKITELYPDVSVYAVDNDDSWLGRLRRILEKYNRKLFKESSGGIYFSRQSFFEPLPNEWGRADIIALHSPFNTTSFLETVKNGEFARVIDNDLKPGGLAFILTDWFEWHESGNPEEPLQAVPAAGRDIFVRALTRDFGRENVAETVNLPKGYQAETLFSYRALQVFKGEDLERVNYGISFFQIRKPESASNLNTASWQMVFQSV